MRLPEWSPREEIFGRDSPKQSNNVVLSYLIISKAEGLFLSNGPVLTI
jgi:hypothetical protein